MDFNSIYQAVAPYLGTGVISTALVGLIGIFCKGIKAFKEMKSTFKDTNAEAIDRFRKALPSELTVSLETITKQEFSKIRAEIAADIKEQFIEPIKANTDLCRAMAEALAVSKLTPDAYKEKIKEMLDLPEVETTNSLKVELNTEEKGTNEEAPGTKSENKILVD
nr:MAG TPA: hypothetical protein [Caudoviricetes sp.]